MTHKLTETQQVQEGWYSFPYHYIGKLYPHFSAARAYDWHLNYASAIEFILDQVYAEKYRGKIVDIGCGDGRMTRELATRFPDARLTGIDYSQQAIRLASALNAGGSILFEARDLVDDPFEGDNDVAVLMEVYEHIEPDKADKFLRGVRDTLRSGGVLHLTVPHQNVPLSPHHFRHFDSDMLRREVSQYFDVEVVKPFERMSTRRKWINRILMNRYFILNHQGLLNRIFRYYMNTMFHCEREDQCQRLYIRAIRR